MTSSCSSGLSDLFPNTFHTLRPDKFEVPEEAVAHLVSHNSPKSTESAPKRPQTERQDQRPYGPDASVSDLQKPHLLGSIHAQSQRGQRPHQSALWVRAHLASEMYKTQFRSLVESLKSIGRPCSVELTHKPEMRLVQVSVPAMGAPRDIPAGLCSYDCLSGRSAPWPLTAREIPLLSSHQGVGNPASCTPKDKGWRGRDKED